MDQEFLTLKEAMQYIGVSKTKMSQLAKGLTIYDDPRDKRKKCVKTSDVEKLRQFRPRE